MAGRKSAVEPYLSGDKLYQKRARAAFPLLVRQATQSYDATIFYSDLAAELGMPNERNLNYVLGYVGDALKLLSRDWKEEIPPIQCLVINKQNRLPGEAIGYFVDNKAEFRKLPRKEQRLRLEVELQKIRLYRKWPSVLSAFGLVPVRMNYAAALAKAGNIGATPESRSSSFGGGGESPEHRRLKDFVAARPDIVGLPKSAGSGKTEYPLKSGDTLDVFFCLGKNHIAAEVKSRLSSEADIVRGMFQCVKYRSVLEAQQAAEKLPQAATAVLVLEAKLPANLIQLKNILGIEVIDEVSPRRNNPAGRSN